jgi:4-carboxymuconolactone decarboxylase
MRRLKSPGTRFEGCMVKARNEGLLTRKVLEPDALFAVVLAGLAALDLDREDLAEELRALVEAGMSADLAEDILVQMAAYLGYPRTAATLAALRLVDDRPRSSGGQPLSGRERYELGTSEYAKLNAEALGTIRSAFGDLAGELIDLTFRSFGDVFATSRQPLPIRQLATVSALAVLGRAAPQLRFHLGAALNVGVTQGQLVETIIWVQHLAGMPAAYNALIELKATLAAGSSAPPAYR